MRIAVLTNAYPPMKGGASRIAELQVQMLEAAGHEVRVWHPNIPWLKWFAPVRLVGHLSDLLPQSYIAKEILAWEPHTLITHNLTGCGFGTPSFIQRQGVRWVHILHDVQLFEPSGSLGDATNITQWQKLWSWMRRKSFGKPNLTISPTAWLLEQHERRGFFIDAKTQVLPNPAPEVAFAMRAPSETLKLFFLGRTRQKGTELLTRLIPRLENVFLHVVEPSREIEELSMRYPDRVRMSAFLPNEEVLDAMRESDVMLFPSQIMENQPTVLLEAAAVGLPAIASDVGGVRETLNGAGIIVPKDDVQGWVEAIEFISDPDHYRDQTTKMYELAKAHDPRAYTERFTGLITEG